MSDGGTLIPQRGASQCDRIAACLADRRPHRMEDIHRAVGFCRLNSRIAELRTRGYTIECDKTGGHYTYRLVGTPEEATATTAAVASSDIPASSDLPSADWGDGMSEPIQLVLT